MRTILVATDGSPSAKKAVGEAVELAKATGWRLRVLTVWSINPAGYGYAPMTYVPNIAELERDHGSEVLRDAIEEIRAAGVEATTELRRGAASEEICEAARECGAALIVVGAHGWGPVKRLVFGSVSSGVMHRATCPVLVVRDVSAAEEREAAGKVTASPTSEGRRRERRLRKPSSHRHRGRSEARPRGRLSSASP